MTSNEDGWRDESQEPRAHLYRAGVYREATEAASAERRELQAEIADLQARVVTLQGRDASLEALVRTMKELLPAADAAPASYTPVLDLAALNPSLGRRDRPAQSAPLS